MADPTAALHGAAKSEVSNGTTNTLDSDSATVAVGDWLVVCIGGGFDDGGAGATDFTIAKQSGTATVGASVTPTSALGQASNVSGNDGGTYTMRSKMMYLPVTGAGTLVVRATRTAGSLDHGWEVVFVRVQNPGTVGAVGVVQDNTSSTTQTVTLDAAPASTSLVLMQCYNNNGAGATTHPSGTTELSDQNAPSFGQSFDVAKQEGSANQANQFTGLANLGTFGRASVAVEILTAAVAFARPSIAVPGGAVHRASRW